MWSLVKSALSKHFGRITQDFKKQVEFEAEVDYVLSCIAHNYDGRKLFMAARKDLDAALNETSN